MLKELNPSEKKIISTFQEHIQSSGQIAGKGGGLLGG